jgi:deoxyribonuclease V
VKPEFTHSWKLSPAEARALQLRLRERVEHRDRLGPITRVAGADVGFERRGAVTRAAVAVLSFPALDPLETHTVRRRTRFPYVPGLLSFREIPAVLAALARLREPVDLLLCDGHGLAHPRRFGLACHLGVLLDRPCIGVAKSRLVGEHGPVPEARGQWTPLVHDDQEVGAVLRTRCGVRPVFVSTGHRVSLATAVSLVMACVTRFRLPETTRHADAAASPRRARR